MARLSAVGSAPDQPVFVAEEYDKLDYPHLECPRERPGFSNGPVPADDYLGAAWVISLERTPERLIEFNAKFPTDWPFVKPSVVKAVDGHANRPRAGFGGGGGAWGCLQSHLQIAKECLANGVTKPVLVLEDDAEIVSIPRILWAMATVPDDAEILFLGGQHFGGTQPVLDAGGQPTQGLVQSKETGRTHAYILYPRFFAEFIRFMEIWHTHIDHGLQFWCKYTTESSVAERIKMIEKINNPATTKALVEGGFLTTQRAFYAADPFAAIQAANRSQISGRSEPSRSWDGRVTVATRPPTDVPTLILHAPREVVQSLRETALIHTGYWRDQATDVDRGLIELMAKPEAQRPAELGRWLATLRSEAAAYRQAAVAFWYPGISDDNAAAMKAALGQPREIKGDTVEAVTRALNLETIASPPDFHSKEAFDARISSRQASPLPMTDFRVFYQIACMGNWKKVVAEQLSLLKHVGLPRAYSCVLGNPDDVTSVREIAEGIGFDLKILYSSADLKEYETPTLQRLWEDARRKNLGAAYMYIHTKGVSTGDAQKARWRRAMQRHLVMDWRNNLRLLELYDVVGCNWQPGNFSHFQGNFWMARGDWIDSLDSPQIHRKQRAGSTWASNPFERMHAELYVLSKPFHHIHSLAGSNLRWHEYSALATVEVNIPGFDYALFEE